MRLTCPNCDAQYEVPDDVIPTEGRDVQCSSCGQTWFQHHADHPPETEETTLTDPAPEEETAPPPEPEPETEPEPERTPEPEPEPEPETEDPPAEPEKPAPSRKELDPAVAEILREEAEAEQALRRQQSSDPLESQPDLGLGDAGEGESEGEEAERRTLEARKRMARMRGEPEPMSEAEVTAAAISSRRDLLPDIDEINSTLRTESDGEGDHAHMATPTAQKRKRGFRSGFLLMIVLFVLLAALYIYAPQIAQAMPGMDPYLSGYVAWVDGMRLWLDGHVQNAARWLDGLASSSGE